MFRVTLLALLGLASIADAVPIRVVARSHLDVSIAATPAGVKVTGGLSDDQGAPVPGAELAIKVGTLSSRLATTDAKGQFQLDVTDSDLGPALDGADGVFLSAEAQFGGDASRGPAEATAATPLLRGLVDLDLAVSPPRSAPGESIRAYATARGPNGPLVGIRLEAELGATTAVAETDSRGRAVFRSFVPPPPGVHTVSLRFRGSARLDTAETSAQVTVARRVAITLDEASTSGPSRISGRAIAQPGGDLAGQVEVQVALPGGESGGRVLVTLDPEGRFAVALDLEALSLAFGPASAEVRVTYRPGADWESASETRSRTLAIQAPPRLSMTSYAIPLLVGLGAVVALWLLRRRTSSVTVRKPTVVAPAPSLPRRLVAGAEPSPGTIYGRVLHGLLQRPLEGAEITSLGDDGTSETHAATDPEGQFAFASVPFGRVLHISSPGFVDRTISLAPRAEGPLGAPIVLTPLRSLTLEVYRQALTRLLGPKVALFGTKTPRDLAGPLGRATRRDTTALTRAFETAYFGGDAAMTEARHHAVVAELEPLSAISPQAPPSRGSR